MYLGTLVTRSLTGTLLLGSVAMICFGSSRTREIRVQNADELAELLDLHPFEEISDFQLTIDATFTGVEYRDGALYSTYDRAAPPTKRLCPT